MTVPFGRYVLKERLAQGGMGEVFRAVAVGEQGFEKPVVIKRILPSHAGRDDLAELFVAEAKLMTRLTHPNIVGVLDLGRGSHRDYYLVLELVTGLDLGRLLHAFEARGEPFPIPLALFITVQTLRGLHHAHGTSSGDGGWLVHRDVSPSNLLLSTEGEVKIADFGIAQVKRNRQDHAGALVGGKIGYMAPEQLDGDVDPRADLFSVGVVLFKMLTCKLPFAADSLEAHQQAALRSERARVRALRADVSEQLEAVLDRALAPTPEGRFPDARAMATALTALGDANHGSHSLATDDDLAMVVRKARSELPASGRPVIALSATSPGAIDGTGAVVETSTEVAPPPHEITRADGVTFTLQSGFPPPVSHRPSSVPSIVVVDRPAADPAVHTLRVAPPDHGTAPPPDEGPSPRAPVLPARTVAGVAMAVGLFLVSLALRAPGPGKGLALVTTASVVPAPSSFAPTPVSAVESGSPIPAEPTATASDVPVAQVPQIPSASRSRVAMPFHPLTASSAKAVETCVGKVHISSNGSWSVSGGPETVQSPGWYTWHCGTFSLLARSREDATRTKNASVTVRGDRSAEIDLR